MSIGGGDIIIDKLPSALSPMIYQEKNFSEVIAYCKLHQLTIPEYAFLNEPNLKQYLVEI